MKKQQAEISRQANVTAALHQKLKASPPALKAVRQARQRASRQILHLHLAAQLPAAQLRAAHPQPLRPHKSLTVKKTIW